jgi:hypothetical protein
VGSLTWAGFESRVLAIAVLRSFPEELGQWLRDGEERAHDRWRDCHRSCVRRTLSLRESADDFEGALGGIGGEA